MKNNKKNGIIVLVIIMVVVALTIVSSFLGQGKDSEQKNRRNPDFRYIMEKKPKDNYIAALYINGVIEAANMEYNQEWLLDTIKTLKNDGNNMALAIFIDSPGGSVYEADEAYLALQDYKTSGKKIYVYQGSLAASGGYYISCAADKIYANRNTLTGSIGVIMGSSYDITGLLEKLGIKSETIHAGKNKTMFSPNEPVTDEQRKIMQSIADECHEQFMGIVAMSRNIPMVELRKIADGRIYTANQALKNGLIDAIDSWDGMIKEMSESCFDGMTFPVVDYRYERKRSLRDFMFETLFKHGELKSMSNVFSEISLRYPAYLYQRP